MPNLPRQFEQQSLANGYTLVDGVAMHDEHGERFQIPHPVLKKHVNIGHFVEVRIDSPRFFVHENAPVKCTCETCNGEMTKPILSHEHPATLVPVPKQDVPSRGWGEDFWVHIVARDAHYFRATVDNPLYESRLHKLQLGDEIILHENHILAVHGSHRQDMMLAMDAEDLQQLAQWLGLQNGSK
jgi:hypothetical protein